MINKWWWWWWWLRLLCWRWLKKFLLKFWYRIKNVLQFFICWLHEKWSIRKVCKVQNAVDLWPLDYWTISLADTGFVQHFFILSTFNLWWAVFFSFFSFFFRLLGLCESVVTWVVTCNRIMYVHEGYFCRCVIFIHIYVLRNIVNVQNWRKKMNVRNWNWWSFRVEFSKCHFECRCEKCEFNVWFFFLFGRVVNYNGWHFWRTSLLYIAIEFCKRLAASFSFNMPNTRALTHSH